MQGFGFSNTLSRISFMEEKPSGVIVNCSFIFVSALTERIKLNFGKATLTFVVKRKLQPNFIKDIYMKIMLMQKRYNKV